MGMARRKLGQSGPEVSAIGLGCMNFSGFYGKTTRDESLATLDAAWTAGINFFDTSDIYGNGLSEEIIGDWLRNTGHQPVIATKGGIVTGAPRGTADNTADGLRARLEASFTRLGVDHVALYYVHRRQFDLPIETVTETLERFREEGLIGGFGYSEISPASLRRAASVAPVAAVQNEYSLWTRLPELGMIQACKELGTTFVPFSPLARGFFSDNEREFEAVTALPFLHANPRFSQPNYDLNRRAFAPFRAFSKARGWSVPALALAWILDQGDHLIPIPGTRSPEHLNAWAAASDISFTPEDRLEIQRLLPVGWAHGDRYSDAQIVGIERYC